MRHTYFGNDQKVVTYHVGTVTSICHEEINIDKKKESNLQTVI